ncbi:hypothetical protein C1877_07255 [Gordonibacter pamelaeae]|uniref:Uncharacterized protein n=1 Tax=Gordonibacter pamelaeae TaxID=471189 RepID=A0A369M410_9ACTN|nr:hypothetical protein C1877_07255 [Gordonibacter pamelaeae]
MGAPGAAGAPGAPGAPGAAAPGAPGADGPAGSAAPQSGQADRLGSHERPHSGHFLFSSTAVGLKHMVSQPLSRLVPTGRRRVGAWPRAAFAASGCLSHQA